LIKDAGLINNGEYPFARDAASSSDNAADQIAASAIIPGKLPPELALALSPILNLV